MNIFNAIKVYAGKWQVKDSRAFSQEEIDAVDKASVVDSQYGLSVCFFLKSGGQSFIPLSSTSSLNVGDAVNLSAAKLLTLSREGDSDILRVEI